MENKRAGFSFKVVAVVGFVLLAFLLLRVFRLNGVVPSEMMPSFLMLLMGVLILATSFILLALGRLVELLQGFRSTHSLLTEIRDETERVRIESQYIYEVQKDTLVKLATISDATSVPDSSASLEDALKNQSANSEQKSTRTPTMSDSETVSKGASFAASRLSKNIDQTKLSALNTGSNTGSNIKQDGMSSLKSDTSDVKANDVKANTDESTWSTLAGNTEAGNIDSQSDSKLDTDTEEKPTLLFDKVVDLPLSDADSDTAALDGSDDIVDDVSQPKTWKPLDDDELVSSDLSIDTLDIGSKITEVKDAEVSDSLDAAVVGLSSDKTQERYFKESEQAAKLEQTKPVFEDRLSQTEKSLEKIKLSEENAVRFGDFPKSTGTLTNSNNFTLEDITEESFNEEPNEITRKFGEQGFSKNTKADSLEEAFSNDKNNTDAVSNSYSQDNSFATKDFDAGEDSFDDIREVFDTKAKKLTSDVKDLTTTSKTHNRIKDNLKSVSDKVTNKVIKENSDVRKNLN